MSKDPVLHNFAERVPEGGCCHTEGSVPQKSTGWCVCVCVCVSVRWDPMSKDGKLRDGKQRSSYDSWGWRLGVEENWGLIYNHSIHSKWGLNVAYATFHAKSLIS